MTAHPWSPLTREYVSFQVNNAGRGSSPVRIRPPSPRPETHGFQHLVEKHQRPEQSRIGIDNAEPYTANAIANDRPTATIGLNVRTLSPDVRIEPMDLIRRYTPQTDLEALQVVFAEHPGIEGLFAEAVQYWDQQPYRKSLAIEVHEGEWPPITVALQTAIGFDQIVDEQRTFWMRFSDDRLFDLMSIDLFR